MPGGFGVVQTWVGGGGGPECVVCKPARGLVLVAQEGVLGKGS